ncbi:MAG: acetoacetate decarboxylase family protein [Myxococcota bacterium]
MHSFDAIAGRQTSEGWVDLPMRFRGRFLHLFFAVAATPVRRRLAEVGLAAVTARGRALVALDVLDYTESTVGPYLELSLGLVARRHGVRSLGVWIDELPVTVPAARAAGREIWGFPKIERDIVLEERGGRIRAGLPGEALVEVAAPRSPALRLPLPLAPYSVLDGRLLRTPLRVTSSLRLIPPSSFEMRLPGDGPVADGLRRYGIEGARPLLASWGDDMVASLHPGEDLGSAPAPVRRVREGATASP